MIENVGFETEIGKPKVNEFRPWHVPNFEKLGFKIAPPFFLG